MRLISDCKGPLLTVGDGRCPPASRRLSLPPGERTVLDRLQGPVFDHQHDADEHDRVREDHRDFTLREPKSDLGTDPAVDTEDLGDDGHFPGHPEDRPDRREHEGE